MSRALESVRFEARISPEPMSGCWLWTGYVRPNGYGSLAIARRPHYAHRFAWELHHGPIPGALSVLHRCDVRSCVNPSHLFLGTAQDNTDDMFEKGRWVKPRGHRGADHHSAKLDRVSVECLRVLLELGIFTKRQLGKWFGVTNTAVGHISSGRSWKHLGDAT